MSTDSSVREPSASQICGCFAFAATSGGPPEVSVKHHLNKILFAWLLLLVSTAASAQQIGKYVPVAAGSDADHAMTEINAATDPAQKLELIDKFAAAAGQGDMALVVDDLYVNYYIAQKQYDKAFEY